MKAFLKKSNLLIMAALIAAGSATAKNVIRKSTAMERWANNNGTWVNVNGQIQQPPLGGSGDYRCDANEETICTAEFPEGTNPNQDASGISNAVDGEYVDL